MSKQSGPYLATAKDDGAGAIERLEPVQRLRILIVCAALDDPHVGPHLKTVQWDTELKWNAFVRETTGVISFGLPKRPKLSSEALPTR